MFGMFFDRITLKLHDCPHQDAADIEGSVIRIYRIFFFGIIVFTLCLSTVKINPMLGIISASCFPHVLEDWVLGLEDEFAEVEVGTTKDFLGADDVGVDEAEDDVVDFGWRMNWHFYFFVPDGIGSIRNNFSSGINHPKFNPDVSIHSWPVHRLNVLSLEDVHCQLVTLSLNVGRQ